MDFSRMNQTLVISLFLLAVVMTVACQYYYYPYNRYHYGYRYGYRYNYYRNPFTGALTGTVVGGVALG
ncbi:hypothetical protein Y032_0026g1364 [Ancylostoma ceylanicum]|nr:hypothetical protein Y032_0026g1364 [Ancylostoma ceylanicum]